MLKSVLKSFSAIALMVLAFTLTGCGGGEDSKPATPAAPAAEKAPTPAPTPPAPKPAAAEHPPVTTPPSPPSSAGGSLRGDAVAGADLYKKYCSSCHGDGTTLGPVGKTLNPPPAKHSDGAMMGKLSDEHLYKVIDKGGPAVGKSPLMAPWGAIVKDQGIKDLIAHLRKISGT